jgi:hypothetical protein
LESPAQNFCGFNAKQKSTACGGGYVRLATPAKAGRVPLSGGTKNRNPVPLIDSGFRVKRGMTCFSKATIFDGGCLLDEVMASLG